MKKKPITIKDEVQEALANGRGVVALESTIISHGMPYPENVKTALEVERIIREEGAVPATVAMIAGELKAGLTEEEIDYLGRKGEEVLKCSRRDLPLAAARRLDGATTVAGTMIAASLAGISLFATGGIGGVHRGGERTFDISADLQELSRTSVAVFCAGAKSILDLGLTLEYLETQGVPVVGYGTDELPAFYTRKSGFPVPYRCNSPREIALMLDKKRELKLDGGVVIANPIPEADQADPELIRRATDQALEEADAQGISGKDSTPFLLARIAEITGGKSLASNIKLVYSNARLAAQTAAARTRA